MSSSSLFDPVRLGDLSLENRIFLPPLTRCRSTQPGDITNTLMAEYYAQRTQAGFLITEGTQIEPRGQGYAWTPGIYSPEQVAGWKLVTNAVHAKRQPIFAQLWHVGRVSHRALQPSHEAPIAPSAVAATGVNVFIPTGPGTGKLVPPDMPRALSIPEIHELVEMYAQAARNALSAGFDGVEIHAANGYLINQFLSERANFRTDAYGGSLSNRLRFLREVVEAVSAVVTPDRLGVRFSPLFGTTTEERVYLGLLEDNPAETYTQAVRVLAEPHLAVTLCWLRKMQTLLCKRGDTCTGGDLKALLEEGKTTLLSRLIPALERDAAAIEASLVTPWTTSPVEGQISRLKMIKRTMFGRAGFELLRARVLQPA